VATPRRGLVAGWCLAAALSACGAARPPASSSVPRAGPDVTGPVPTASGVPTSTPTTVPLSAPGGTLPTTTMPAFGGVLVQSASFVTGSDGFALGLVSCPPSTCVVLRHTVDGGRRWVPEAVPPVSPRQLAAGDVEAELHFADPLDGWIYGPGLWATHDGARTWHAVALGGTVRAMATGAGEAYALVDPCPSASCTAAGRLYRSAAGSDRWTDIPSVSADFLDAPAPPSLVAEGSTVDVLTAAPSPRLWTSPDGVVFVALPLPCAPSGSSAVGPTEPAAVAASDPDDIVVLCLGGVATGNQVKQAWISHDGGRAFSRLPDPPLGGDGADPAMPAPGSLFVASSSSVTLLYGDEPTGSPWTTTMLLADGGAGLSDLGFIDPRHGFFVHDPAWHALEEPGAGRSLDPGTLFATSDGGTTWRPIAIG